MILNPSLVAYHPCTLPRVVFRQLQGLDHTLQGLAVENDAVECDLAVLGAVVQVGLRDQAGMLPRLPRRGFRGSLGRFHPARRRVGGHRLGPCDPVGPPPSIFNGAPLAHPTTMGWPCGSTVTRQSSAAQLPSTAFVDTLAAICGM